MDFVVFLHHLHLLVYSVLLDMMNLLLLYLMSLCVPQKHVFPESNFLPKVKRTFLSTSDVVFVFLFLFLPQREPVSLLEIVVML